jgi:hypothetical protein
MAPLCTLHCMLRSHPAMVTTMAQPFCAGHFRCQGTAAQSRSYLCTLVHSYTRTLAHSHTCTLAHYCFHIVAQGAKPCSTCNMLYRTTRPACTMHTMGMQRNHAQCWHNDQYGRQSAITTQHAGTMTSMVVHTRTLVHSYTRTIVHSYTRTFVHSYTPSCTLVHSYTRTLVHSYTRTLVHSYTHTLIHSYTRTLSCAGRTKVLNT